MAPMRFRLEQAHDVFCKTSRVLNRAGKAAVRDDVWDRLVVAAGNRYASRHCFENRQRQPIKAGGVNENVRARKDLIVQDVARDSGEPAYAIFCAWVGFRCVRIRVHHSQADRGMPLSDDLVRPHRYVSALHVEVPDKQKLARRAIRHLERRQLDGRWHDVDSIWRRRRVAYVPITKAFAECDYASRATQVVRSMLNGSG